MGAEELHAAAAHQRQTGHAICRLRLVDGLSSSGQLVPGLRRLQSKLLENVCPVVQGEDGINERESVELVLPHRLLFEDTRHEILEIEHRRVGLIDELLYWVEPALPGVLTHPDAVDVDQILLARLLGQRRQLLLLQVRIRENGVVHGDAGGLREVWSKLLNSVRPWLGDQRDIQRGPVPLLAQRAEAGFLRGGATALERRSAETSSETQSPCAF